MVLDALARDRQAVELGSEAARDGCAPRVGERLAHRRGSRRGLHELRAAEVLREPNATLPEWLRVRVDPLDRREAGEAREQALGDVELEAPPE